MKIPAKLQHIRYIIKKLALSFYTKHELWVKYIAQIIFMVIVYGIIITFILKIFFSQPFTISRILAWGLVAYIVKVELPVIISSSLPRPPKGGVIYDTMR